MTDQTNQVTREKIIVLNQKSVGVTIILTFLFGPLGMLYSTVLGAVVMFFINVLALFFTAGKGLIFTWPICIVWGVVATNNYNKTIQ